MARKGWAGPSVIKVLSGIVFVHEALGLLCGAFGRVISAGGSVGSAVQSAAALHGDLAVVLVMGAVTLALMVMKKLGRGESDLAAAGQNDEQDGD
jgi:hypothetical protein